MKACLTELIFRRILRHIKLPKKNTVIMRLNQIVVEENKRHIYEYEVNLNSGSAPARVIRMVGAGKKVLELGTGPGSITRHLAGEGHCRVTGIELNDEAIELVRPFCDVIHKADLNKPDWVSLVAGDGRFDVVVAADVLEHLYDPWTTLVRMEKLVNKGGSLVLSLPHIGHAVIAACLMAEDFEYHDCGLLDRTHIRFFGIKNIQDLFEKAGLKIIEAEFLTYAPEQTEFAHHWAKLSDHIKQGLLENPHSTVYQVIVRAVPENAEGEAIQLIEQLAEKYVPPSPYADSAPVVEISAGNVKLIAFYLPQYHPIPENDLWWGKGFTEWSNVTKAMSLFEGHYQPHLPSDLGFYDLRLRETRHEQVAMAKQYGIYGFCYHYYWFSGKRLLDRPLDDMLADSECNMPFCLCWANENWTRRWDAAEHEVLIAQEYREDDDVEFIKSLIPFFRDSRYIRKDGAPFFVVYRPQQLPDPKKTISIWREYCRKEGFDEIHVCCALTHGNEDYQQYGFNSGVEFPPHNVHQMNINEKVPFDESFKGHLMVYDRVATSYLNRIYVGKDVFKTVFPSWDNTARVSSRALIVLNGTPANYEYWLAETIRRNKTKFPDEERFVFINAWNEWAEGCHLEPDQRYGHQFLEATFRAKTGMSQKMNFEDRMLPKWPKDMDAGNAMGSNGVTDFLQKAQDEIFRAREESQDEISFVQEEAHREITRLNALLDEIQHSMSWRITAPVRVVGRIGRKVLSRKKE